MYICFQFPGHITSNFFQALVPSPVPLDPNPIPKQSKIQIQVQLGLGWHQNHMGHPPPPITFNHEVGLGKQWWKEKSLSITPSTHTGG